MKNLYFSLLFLLFISGYSQSIYTFEVENNSYQNLQNATILTNSDWDDPALSAPLGFDFQLGTHTFNTIYIPDWSVGGIASSSANDTGIIPILLLIGQDIESRGIGNSPISYKTEGVAGSRIFKLEWNNFGFFDDSTLNDFMNMQLWLYEGSNIIEYRYGPNSVTNPSESFEGESGPSVALITSYDMDNDSITDETYLLSGSPDNPSVLTFHAGENADSAPLNGAIPSGTIYRFTPQNTNSIQDLTNTSVFAYPNPAKSFISISTTHNDAIKSVTIYNSTGNLVKKVKQANHTIDISNLSNGIYLLKIKTEQGDLFTSKFIKTE